MRGVFNERLMFAIYNTAKELPCTIMQMEEVGIKRRLLSLYATEKNASNLEMLHAALESLESQCQ